MGMRIFIYGEDGFTNSTLANSLSILGLDVIGEIDNEIVAYNLITHHCPDAVLLLIDHGHIRAIELARIIRKNFPNMGIVLATKSEDIRLIGIDVKRLPNGVLIEQISKHGDLDKLKLAIEKSINSTQMQVDFHRCKYLSDPQIETLRLMAEGNANSEIAKMRYVSEKSVEQMLTRTALILGIAFDRQHNSRVRLLNSYYELVNGRR